MREAYCPHCDAVGNAENFESHLRTEHGYNQVGLVGQNRYLFRDGGRMCPKHYLLREPRRWRERKRNN